MVSAVAGGFGLVLPSEGPGGRSIREAPAGKPTARRRPSRGSDQRDPPARFRRSELHGAPGPGTIELGVPPRGVRRSIGGPIAGPSTARARSRRRGLPDPVVSANRGSGSVRTTCSPAGPEVGRARSVRGIGCTRLRRCRSRWRRPLVGPLGIPEGRCVAGCRRGLGRATEVHHRKSGCVAPGAAARWSGSGLPVEHRGPPYPDDRVRPRVEMRGGWCRNRCLEDGVGASRSAGTPDRGGRAPATRSRGPEGRPDGTGSAGPWRGTGAPWSAARTRPGGPGAAVRDRRPGRTPDAPTGDADRWERRDGAPMALPRPVWSAGLRVGPDGPGRCAEEPARAAVGHGQRFRATPPSEFEHRSGSRVGGRLRGLGTRPDPSPSVLGGRSPEAGRAVDGDVGDARAARPRECGRSSARRPPPLRSRGARRRGRPRRAAGKRATAKRRPRGTSCRQRSAGQAKSEGRRSPRPLVTSPARACRSSRSVRSSGPMATTNRQGSGRSHAVVVRSSVRRARRPRLRADHRPRPAGVVRTAPGAGGRADRGAPGKPRDRGPTRGPVARGVLPDATGRPGGLRGADRDPAPRPR